MRWPEGKNFIILVWAVIVLDVSPESQTIKPKTEAIPKQIGLSKTEHNFIENETINIVKNNPRKRIFSNCPWNKGLISKNTYLESNNK